MLMKDFRKEYEAPRASALKSEALPSALCCWVSTPVLNEELFTN